MWNATFDLYIYIVILSEVPVSVEIPVSVHFGISRTARLACRLD